MVTDYSPASALRQIQSERLNLIASTRDLIKKDIEGSEFLAAALGVAVPESWQIGRAHV